jgi:hypothetical protein
MTVHTVTTTTGALAAILGTLNDALNGPADEDGDPE